MAKLKWGILGTGNIAKAFANGLLKSKSSELIAVGSRSQESADKFGEEFKVSRRHASYEALLADTEVQAVYICTPHPMHAEWAIKTAEAKKHILCEKPIGLNHAEAMAITEAAIRNDVFCMEAFMYRCHPQTKKLVELIKEKVIGDVRVIQATFSFHAGFNADSRLFANKLAGGGILDVGCYCTSMAGLIAGAAQGKEMVDALEVKAVGYNGPTSVDHWTAAVVKYPGNIVAQLSTGVEVNQESVVRIFGSGGNIFVPSPWFCSRHGEPSKIIVNRNGKPSEEVIVESGMDLYSIEADTVGASIEKRQAPSPAMTTFDSLSNLRTMDAWREQIGLEYEAEKWANVPTVHRKPLVVSSKHNMTYGTIPGLEKKVSRLVMGVDNQRNMPHAAVMFDDYIERGGNCFDSAYIYAGGKLEKLLGQYIKNRGVREQAVILDKGAHSPFCNPKDLSKQFKESLERLQMSYVDIYMMHRDNLDVPVGEFVDVLNEFHRAGEMKVFGGSNWSIERVEAANEYAKKKSLKGFSVVSNNFSLARMVDPIWGGCISASDPASRAWFTKHQIALMPWSSQARGFFTERAHPDDKSDAEMVRCWYAEDNWKRRERVLELAKKKGVLPINVALAYVLCQPFPTFPLIGPRILSETRTSLPGLDVKLTPDEVKWLNLEA